MLKKSRFSKLANSVKLMFMDKSGGVFDKVKNGAKKVSSGFGTATKKSSQYAKDKYNTWKDNAKDKYNTWKDNAKDKKESKSKEKSFKEQQEELISWYEGLLKDNEYSEEVINNSLNELMSELKKEESERSSQFKQIQNEFERVKEQEEKSRREIRINQRRAAREEKIKQEELKKYEAEKEKRDFRKKGFYERGSIKLEKKRKEWDDWWIKKRDQTGKYATEGLKFAKGPKTAVEYVGRRTKEILRGQFGEAGDAGGWMFIFLTIILYLIDVFVLNFNGINIQRFIDNLAFTSVESYIGWFLNSIVITLIIAYYVIYKPKPNEFISWVVVAETISLILFLGGGGTGMLVHLGFVIAFYFLYIRYSIAKQGPAEDMSAANYTFFALLFFDFFGYGLLAQFINNPAVANRLIIPVWFYFALIYTKEKERTTWINLLIIIVILINVFYFMGGVQGLRNMTDVMTDADVQEGIGFWKTGWEQVKDTFASIREGFRESLDRQLIYATGGYYKGQVEKNKIGPLGVFIEEVKSSQPRYYENENIIIWGKIKALSLGDGINIDVDCRNKDASNSGGTSYLLQDLYANKVTPNRAFTIYSLEARDFECVFESGFGLFESGFNKVSADVSFNFETLAYLKTYFMDVQRKRDMVREGLDPFKEFGIQDTNPIATYTDGPVIIGMETTSPIIEVGSEVITQPRIGITLENKQGWEGKITSLSEIILLAPYGISIADPENDCTIPFKPYTWDKCEEESCTNFVLEPCKNICSENKKSNPGYSQENLDRCNRNCEKSFENCKKDCSFIFEGEDKSKPYMGYAINTDEIDVRDHFKDVDRYRSFSCRLNIDSGEILGNTPLTVRYFRTKARYNYTVTKDIDIQIIPETTQRVTPTTTITGTMPRKIAQIADELGVSNNYALGIAALESSFRHCCQDTSGTSSLDCEGTEEESCAGRLIAGEYNGNKISFGVMQLNKKAHPLWYDPGNCASNSQDPDCIIFNNADCRSGEDAENLDCNIRIGLAYLKYLYDKYKTETKVYSCGTKAKTYSGWDLALRYYNGFTCSGNLDYVEDVKEKIEKINNGELASLINQKADKG